MPYFLQTANQYHAAQHWSLLFEKARFLIARRKIIGSSQAQIFIMSEQQQQQHHPGGHYSGANPVPTVKKFLDNLDKDKKERDRRIEEERRGQQRVHEHGAIGSDERSSLTVKGSQKKVTDPTTGQEAVIEDVKPEIIDVVDRPKVSSLRIARF